MKLKKLLSSLTALSCAVPFISAMNINDTSADNTIKIMSVGDSITDGYGIDGSYRKFLYNALTKNGCSVDMVGPNWAWGDAEYSDDSEAFTYDAAHCGYSGYAIKEYSGRNGILETIKNGDYLSVYTPDIVILQIGTNDVIDNHDIDTAGERLEELASYILRNISPESSLFITTIPDLDPNRSDVYSWFGNYRHSADWQTQYSDEEAEANVHAQVANYNKQVKETVERLKESGVKNVYFGDVNSVITDVKTQLNDGVHPNNTGYRLMGNYWYEQLSTFLSDNPDEPATEPVTEVTTESTTEITTELVTEITTESTTEITTESTTEITTESTTEITTESTTEITTEPTTTIPPLLKGDIDLNGSVSVNDAILLSKFLTGKIILEQQQLTVSDLNDDNKINVFDFATIKKIIIGQTEY